MLTNGEKAGLADCLTSCVADQNLPCTCYACVKDRNVRLTAAIEGALRIEHLWMPPDDQNDPNHDHEFAALASMRNTFRELAATQ